MNYKNVLNQVRALLSLEVKLEQQTLMDGVTTIEAEQFAPDYSVGIVTADGAIPMPVGEYTLQNGDILVVEKEGIISSVGNEAEEEANPADVNSPADVNEPQPKGNAKPATTPVMAENTPKKTVETVSKETFFAEIEKIKTELVSQIDTLKTENESLKTQLSEVAGAKAITPNPEAIIEKDTFQFGSKRERTTEDVVFSKLFKN